MLHIPQETTQGRDRIGIGWFSPTNQTTLFRLHYFYSAADKKSALSLVGVNILKFSIPCATPISYSKEKLYLSSLE